MKKRHLEPEMPRVLGTGKCAAKAYYNRRTTRKGHNIKTSSMWGLVALLEEAWATAADVGGRCSGCGTDIRARPTHFRAAPGEPPSCLAVKHLARSGCSRHCSAMGENFLLLLLKKEINNFSKKNITFTNTPFII